MNGQLDCNTERGRIAIADERIAIDVVLRHFSEKRLSAVTFPEASKIDAMFIYPNDCSAFAAEVKARDFTLDTLQGPFRNEWLITADKLVAMRMICFETRIFGYGILYLKPDQLVLMVQIFDNDGVRVLNWSERITETQATCNGGTAMRLNAFIPMHNAIKIPV